MEVNEVMEDTWDRLEGYETGEWEEVVGKMDIGEVPNEDKAKLLKTLYPYRHLVPRSVAAAGCFDEVRFDFDLKLKKDAPSSSRYKLRKIKKKYVPQVTEQLEAMERMGIIEPGNPRAKFVSALHVVPKPGKPDEVRITSDFTNLNPYVEYPTYPLPSIEDSILDLKDGKYYIIIDGRNFFWNIRCTERAKELSSFMHPIKGTVYRWTRMAMGHESAPGWCSYVTQEAFKGVEMTKYFDDWAIKGDTVEEALEKAEKFLKIASKYGIKINFAKCKWLKKKVEFLGSLVDEDGHGPSLSHVEKAKLLKLPTTKKHLQSQLGFANFIADRVESLAALRAPLLPLLKKGVVFKLTPSMKEAWEELRMALANAKWLHHFDSEKKVVIMTDGSENGIGGALMHETEDGKYEVV
ncbi:MAG: RNA-directed DNA polymerase, partial [bacterium]|nr:RNA-directed DNA polymerase [bacterium]